MLVVLQHPEVAFRDCQHCLRFVYEEDGPNVGRLRIGRDGNPEPRPRGTYAPCRRPSGSCPKGTPENPIILSERNWQAWDFYKRCKLTGRWPDDPIVLEMGVLLDELLERVRDARMAKLVATGARLAVANALAGPAVP